MCRSVFFVKKTYQNAYFTCVCREKAVPLQPFFEITTINYQSPTVNGMV